MYSVAGPAYYIFNLQFGLLFLSVLILIRKRKSLPPLHQTRLDALILAQSCLVIFGVNDVLPIIGIEKYPFTNWPVYPYGSIAAVLLRRHGRLQRAPASTAGHPDRA